MDSFSNLVLAHRKVTQVISPCWGMWGGWAGTPTDWVHPSANIHSHIPGSIPPMGIPGQHKTVLLLKMGDTENDWLQSNISEKRSAWCLDASRRPGVHMGTKRWTGPVREEKWGQIIWLLLRRQWLVTGRATRVLEDKVISPDLQKNNSGTVLGMEGQEASLEREEPQSWVFHKQSFL